MTKPADSRIGDVPPKAEREGVATLPQKSGKEKFTDKLSQLKSLVSAERAAVTPVSVSVGAAKAASPFLKNKKVLACICRTIVQIQATHMPHCTCACIAGQAGPQMCLHTRCAGATRAHRCAGTSSQMCKHICEPALRAREGEAGDTGAEARRSKVRRQVGAAQVAGVGVGTQV